MSARSRFIKPILIVLAVVLTGSAIIYWAALAFSRAMMSADPFPTFMADYEHDGLRTRTYEEAERGFSDFVVKAFPVGSDAHDAIAQIRGGGFEATPEPPESVRLLWKRHSGPCSEQYWIVVRMDADHRIASISGRLQPICL